MNDECAQGHSPVVIRRFNHKKASRYSTLTNNEAPTPLIPFVQKPPPPPNTESTPIMETAYHYETTQKETA